VREHTTPCPFDFGLVFHERGKSKFVNPLGRQVCLDWVKPQLTESSAFALHLAAVRSFILLSALQSLNLLVDFVDSFCLARLRWTRYKITR
jgi:hypothetical protein